jgi:hypothetical protein
METNALSSSERDILIQSVQAQIKQIDSDIQHLSDRRAELEALLTKLSSAGQQNNYDQQSKNQSWLKKSGRTLKQLCVEALQKLDDFQGTADVYEYIRECYPDSKHADRDKVIASVSWSLTQLSEEGAVVKVTRNFSKGFYWGLPSWFNVDGIALGEYRKKLMDKGAPEFIYDKEAQVKKGKLKRTK